MPTADLTSRPMPTPCPLAVDPDGHPIELPETATAWRVRRKTGGRPRIVLGVDKQPVQLPLSYSLVDLEDILAPAEYLLDVVDAKGEAVGITIAVSLSALRNADGQAEEPGENREGISAMLPTTASDTRLVLEANVRATQMAFLHNQKTLEMGLRMAETLRDVFASWPSRKPTGSRRWRPLADSSATRHRRRCRLRRQLRPTTKMTMMTTTTTNPRRLRAGSNSSRR